MALIIQYFRNDGTCRIEKSNINARYIEMMDGDHPVTNDSVWQDNKRRRQPILAIFEGVLGPLGSDMAEEDIISLLTEIELIKLGFKKASVSKMWMRSLERIFEFIRTKALYIGIIAFVLYMLASSVMEGA